MFYFPRFRPYENGLDLALIAYPDSQLVSELNGTMVACLQSFIFDISPFQRELWCLCSGIHLCNFRDTQDIGSGRGECFSMMMSFASRKMILKLAQYQPRCERPSGFGSFGEQRYMISKALSQTLLIIFI